MHAIVANKNTPYFGAAQLLLIDDREVVFEVGRVQQLPFYKEVVALRENPQAPVLKADLLELVLGQRAFFKLDLVK